MQDALDQLAQQIRTLDLIAQFPDSTLGELLEATDLDRTELIAGLHQCIRTHQVRPTGRRYCKIRERSSLTWGIAS